LIQDTNQLYIYPAGCIVGPLLAVPNVIDNENVSKNQFIVCSGYHKWGMFFKRYSEQNSAKKKRKQKVKSTLHQPDKNYW
jgi:hypothetical protein